MNPNNKNSNELNYPKFFGDEKSVIDESFSVDFSDAYEKEMNLNKDLNETILDQKLKKINDNREKVKIISDKVYSQVCNPEESFFIVDKEQIRELEKNENLSKKNKAAQDFLEPRKLPQFNEKEYLKIRKSVSEKLLPIQNYLIGLKINYTQFDPNKKVGPIMPLTYIIENNYQFKPENANEMQKQYEKYKNYIYNFRTIYSDGNCFFRAVMFRYIELLILYRKTDYIKSLIIDIHKSFQSSEIKKRLHIGNDYLNPQLIIQVMITILELIENFRVLEAHLAFYKALLFSKIFDYSLILYFRYIAYTYIKKNEKKMYKESFPILIGNLLPSNFEKNGKFDFNSFYNNHLLKMFSYTEKMVIYLTPFILGLNLNLVIFEDKENNIIQKYNYTGNSDLNINDNIFILNRKKHYELIFSLEDNQKYNGVYQYYIYRLPPSFIKLNNSNNNNNLNNGQNSSKQNYNQNNNNNNNSFYIVQTNINNQNNNIILQSKTFINTCSNNNMKNRYLENNSNDNYKNNINYQNNNYNNPNINNNNLNKNSNNNNKEEEYLLKTNIYFFLDKNNIIKYHYFFDPSQNIYSLGQLFNNNNIDKNINNNMKTNMNNNNINNNMNNNMINSNNNNINFNNNMININNNMINNDNNNDENNMSNSLKNIQNNLNNVTYDSSNRSSSFNLIKDNDLDINDNLKVNNNNKIANNSISISILYKNDKIFDMSALSKEINNTHPFRCNKCNFAHSGLKTLNNICKNCFILEIINQSRITYIEYLKNVTIFERANTITKRDFQNYFLNKIIIIYNNKRYNIYEAIEELNSGKDNKEFDPNKKLDEIISGLKQIVCLYCFCNVTNNEFTLICGCNFCSYNHLDLFFKEKIKNKLSYNYKCFCSYEYMPNKVLELCNFLKNKNIYKDFNSMIKNLNQIFNCICFKCGNEKNNLNATDIEGFCPIKFQHFICEDCVQADTSNYVKCSICNIQHKYLLSDF